jgi:hypothetical protein
MRWTREADYYCIMSIEVGVSLSAAEIQTSQSRIASVSFSSVRFSDGTQIPLAPDDIIVFVGPNNAGKTSALYALDTLAHEGDQATKVVVSAEMSRVGTTEDLLSFLVNNFKTIGDAPNRQFSGVKSHAEEKQIDKGWTGALSLLSRFFCFVIRTDQRLSDSNATQGLDSLERAPDHPIHLMFLDDELEKKIGGYFKKVFGQDLSVFRLGGSKMPLLVGDRPKLEVGEDRLSTSYNKRLLREAAPLSSQGDGMRAFATVLLRTLGSPAMSILLLDEPEAFLHPPQARYLAEVIAKERGVRTQLFIATHSEDILQGLLNAAPAQLRIIRLTHEGSINRARELDRTLTTRISADPLMRFTSVLSGIFHERVIVCESDADCMFYNAILSEPGVHGTREPDVRFLQSGGKHRLASLAETLRALNVNVDVIADIDILNDLDVLRGLVLALGGEWNKFESLAKAIKSAIEQRKDWLDSSEVVRDIRAILDRSPTIGTFPQPLRQEVNRVFAKSSPWDAVKSAGTAAIPAGQATQQYKTFESMCSGIGLWIVPVGELEGFCRPEGAHGPRWVQNVLKRYSPAEAPELSDAREFMRCIWNRI